MTNQASRSRAKSSADSTEYDYDVLVVGSGFGGSVAALRLVEKGYRVGVLEAGRRFEDADFFAEPESDKVMASWTLHMEVEGKPVKLRGLDIFQFRGDKLIRKLAYCKAAKPQIVEA